MSFFLVVAIFGLFINNLHDAVEGSNKLKIDEIGDSIFMLVLVG